MAAEKPARFRVTVESPFAGHAPVSSFEVWPFEHIQDEQLYGRDAQSIAVAVAGEYADSGDVRVEEIGGDDRGRVNRQSLEG